MSNPLKDPIDINQIETELPDLSDKPFYVSPRSANIMAMSRRKMTRETHWPRRCIVRRNFDNDESKHENDLKCVSRHEFDELTKKVDELLIELHALKIRMNAQEPDVEDERY